MKNFDKLIGNELVKKRLSQMLATHTVPHLLLFSGAKDANKRQFAEVFATNWLDQASGPVVDLYSYTPEGKLGMHSIQAVRRLLDEVNLAPFSAGKKAFIIEDAERMLPTSSNALLKTLEEPPKNTLIILLSSAPEKLLPTIVSRCQVVRFCPVAKSSEQHAALYEHLAKKRPFFEVSQFAKEFQKSIDLKKKEQETALKAEFAAMLKEASASQRQMIEQEIEGALSVTAMHEVQELLLAIQAFFLERERQDSSRSYQQVARSLSEAKQALERSTPIQYVLEDLLLQLGC